MYSFGRATDGQLGIGAVEENHILNPTWIRKFDSRTIQRVACGLRHTLFLVDGNVYSCGSNEKGQLGQEESTTRPAPVPYFVGAHYQVTQVGCGHAHSVALTKNGSIITWGDNEFGQLGRTQGGQHSPYYVDAKILRGKDTIQIACGAFHNIILTKDCCVLTWGRNDHGQLGHSSPDKTFVGEPVICDNLLTLPVCQVEAGAAHSVVLTRGGYMFSCGRNNFGQLGLAHTRDVEKFTEMVEMSVCNINIKYVACGDEHTAMLADNGCCYTCGSNRYGQLGHRDFVNTDSPKIIDKFIGDDIYQIACGRMHTILALDTGEVYSFGLGASGQLGQNSTVNLCTPVKVEKEWVAGQKYLDYFERMEAEQFDDIDDIDDDDEPLASYNRESTYYMYQLFAGGDQSFVAVTSCGPSGQSSTSVRQQKLTALLSDSDYETSEPPATASSSTTTGASVSASSAAVWMEPDDGISSSTSPTSSSPAAAVAVGAASSTLPPPRDYRIIPACETPLFLENHLVQQWLNANESRRTLSMKDCVKTLEVMFSNPSCLNGSFHDRKRQCTKKKSGINLVNAGKAFPIMRKRLAPDDNECRMNYIRAVVMKIPVETLPHDYNLERRLITKLLPAIPPNAHGYESYKAYYLLPTYMVCEPPRLELMHTYLKHFVKLDKKPQEMIGEWFYNGNLEYLRQLIRCVREMMNSLIKKSKDHMKRALKADPELKAQLDLSTYERFTPEEEEVVLAGLEFMCIIADRNIKHAELIPITDFHLSQVIDSIDLAEDYFTWMTYLEQVEKIIFCRFPACLDVKAKSRLMLCDCKLAQQIAISRAQGENFRSLVTEQKLTDYSPFSIDLNIHRDNIVNNTLTQLVAADPSNFKKPLKVVFIGEEGDDEGGVKKEFFMILFSKILNPDFGMFVEDEESHLIWFSEQPLSYENVEYFTLIGILCGLAIYNDVLIDLPFPAVLYRKLLNSPCRLRDFRELHPSEADGLKTLLEYDELEPDFSDVFDLTFTINRKEFGEVKTIQLTKGGQDMAVTHDNRDMYVSLYLKYCLHDAVEEPFRHFKDGFMRVCGGRLLNELVHPLELKELLVGKRVTEWSELQKHMQYRNGYTSDHPAIKLFWEVFEDFTEGLKRKFLIFLTGSDRIPLFGVEQMHMMIQKMDGGPHCEKLPVAHTCFNVLDLPPYETRVKMKTKLLQAVNFTSGFGII